MIIFFDATIIVIILVIIFALVTSGSSGIINFFDNHLNSIIIICAVICIAVIIGHFILSRKTKKAYFIIPFLSLPSLSQFLFFSIHGIISMAKVNPIFSFFILLGYVIWLIVSGFGTIVAQVCCAGSSILFDKYESTSDKFLVLIPPIVIGGIGWFVNYLLFF